jgi:hypothetical protein
MEAGARLFKAGRRAGTVQVVKRQDVGPTVMVPSFEL